MNSENRKLSKQQSRVLYELCRAVRANEQFPSHRELCVTLSMQNSSLIHSLKKLREWKYIEKIPKSRGYRILRWLDEETFIPVPVIGFTDKDMALTSRNNPVAHIQLSSTGGRCKGIDKNEFFAVKVLQDSSCLSEKSKHANIVIFRNRCTPSNGNTILASLNGIQRLFQIKISAEEILLLQKEAIPIRL